ncbi:MAG: ABC transporter permease [Mesorhizobium sp.]|nr:MAG: ABC transporter permease [Mesorhizobium sp.]
MIAYLGRRVIQSVLILLGVSLITFALLYLLPADPVRQIAGRSATPETVENIRRQLGLDQPFVIQYWHYLTSLLSGDLGRSYIQRSEVTELIVSRLPASLLLMVGAILCELAIGLTMGLLAAVRRGTATDQTLMVASFVGVSAPQFVVGLLLLYIFAVRLGWFPIGGYGTWRHLVLPSLTMGILGAGWYARMMRSSMIDVLRQDYMRTARAKGLARGAIIFRHALPNAILPVIAMIGIDIGIFMGGIVVVESVFGWPGIGKLMIDSIIQRDFAVVQSTILVTATAIFILNIAIDLLYAVLDPRIRY